MHTVEQIRSGELAGIRRLKLACGLRVFPREIMDLADSLEILDLSGNALSALPDDLARLHKLRVIFCSDNAFTELPEVLGTCHALRMIGFKANRIRRVSGRSLPAGLRWLILTDNAIEALPAEIGNCSQLQKLMLAGNRLKDLPESLAQCQRLELIRIAANQLQDLPTGLLALPRLSWLAYSGNPFCAPAEAGALAAATSDGIPWGRLELGQVLGEGASGVIHQATYSPAGHTGTGVAVKLFKGAVTSDGLPAAEMAASVAASTHANLIPVIGRLADHPAGCMGLVMELMDPALHNLAGPPSLESCTRDVYQAEVRFALPVLLRLAQGVAAAARHLHARGIMHGDLYGHNILHCGQGRTLLGDFGAASFYAHDDRATADALQRLEVRAFACLLEELLDRCDTGAEHEEAFAMLLELKSACMSEKTDRRPLFDEIAVRLHSVSRTLPGEAARAQ